MNIFEVLIVQPLFNLLLVLYNAIPGGDFGVSIILFTILLRVVMYPLVKKQLHQTKLMRKLQPELEQIKKRTKGNRQLQGIQMMELYKRHGVSPFRSIGILLIQLPIFIALYLVIQVFVRRDEFAKYTYDFLENIPSINQIVQTPDSFNETFLGVVDLTEHAINSDGINFILVGIAIIAAVGQYFQSKQTMPQDPAKRRRLRDIMSDAANGKEADQSEINNAVMGKMIVVLPFVMLVIILNLPGALPLYYATMTLVAIMQQSHILKQDEEDLEDIAEEHPQKKAASGKKATAKARAKAANDATVTRVVAKPSASRKGKRTKGGKK